MRRLGALLATTSMVVAAGLLQAGPAHAANVLTVPSGFATIQAAIDAAANGDTVVVAPGTYFENINFKGKQITVESSQGPSVTTIDGGQLAPVVNFSTGETTASVLQGFTIQHGYATSTYQYMGGGVHINGASPTIIGNTITANSACGHGAGISVQSPSATVIDNNTIVGNSKQTGCSGDMGGGIAILGGGSAQITHNVISSNSTDFGGAIALDGAGTPTILDNTMNGNSVAIQGGAIYAVNQSDAAIVQNLITGNSSLQNGGGLYISPPYQTRGALLVNNTLAGNTGSDSGVFVGGFDSQVQLSNNIVVAGDSKPAILCDTSYSATPPIFDHNDVFNATGPATQGSCAQIVGTGGNISADPQFVSSSDYHLSNTSPAIDAGNNSAPSLPATDFDGSPRVNGPVVDQGVYEVQRPLAIAMGSAVTAVEGASFSQNLASFTGGYGPFGASVDWGDGLVTAAAVSGGVISGSHTYGEEGTYTARVTITDSTGATASGTAPAAVADATLTLTATPTTAVEGASFSGTVATFTDADPNGTASDYVATINWGDQTTSAGSVAAGGGGFVVAGTHSYAEEGTYTVSVTVNDAGTSAGTSAAASTSDAALSASGSGVSATEGANFSGQVATFTDADPNGTISDYSATISWGDQSTSAGSIVAGNTGGFTITGSHTYVEEGSYIVTVKINDAGGASATTTAAANVADAALDVTVASVTATEGASFSGQLATLTDTDPNGAAADYSITINWGDQSSSGGTAAANASGGFMVSGTHTYAEEGTYAVTVFIADAGGATITSMTTAVVADAALTATGVQLSEHHNTTFTATVATMTDADPGGVAADYTGMIAWGDGTTTACPGTACKIVRQSNGSFTVSATHSYRNHGTYKVTIQLSDAGGATTKTTTTISAS